MQVLEHGVTGLVGGATGVLAAELSLVEGGPAAPFLAGAAGGAAETAVTQGLDSLLFADQFNWGKAASSVAVASLSAGLADRAGIRPAWNFKLWRARTIRELFNMRSSKALFRAFGLERFYAYTSEEIERNLIDHSAGGGFFGSFYGGDPEFSTITCGSFGGCSFNPSPPE
jgi:hypothetical protein